MADLLRVVLALLFAVLPALASAQDTVPVVWKWNLDSGPFTFASPAAACASGGLSVGEPMFSSDPPGQTSAYKCVNAAGVWYAGTARQATCPAGYNIQMFGTTPSCKKTSDTDPVDPPNNNTDDKKCADAALLHNSIGTDRIGRINGKHPLGKEVQVCRDSGLIGNSGQPLGCAHSFTGESSFQKPGGWVTEGESWANTDSSAGNGVGLACALGLDKDPDKPEDADKRPQESKPSEKCRNGYAGSVNGVDVCIDRASGEQNGVNFTRVTDGNGAQSDLRTSVTCVRDVCTVTEIKTPIGRSGSPTTTTTNNVDRAQFCRTNGSNPVCGTPTGSSTKPGGTTGGGAGGGTGGNTGGGGGSGNGDGEDEGDKSEFGGSCSAGFTCKGDAKGDAIQCAIAKEQHARACKLFDDKTSESELYEAEKAKDPNRNVTKDLPGNASHTFGSDSFSQAETLGAAMCISDLAVDVFGKTVSLPLSKVCPYIAWLRTILLAIGALLWMVIVFKG